MILDYIRNIERYKGISYNIDTAIDYLLATDIATLPLGKTIVDNDKVYINIMEATTQSREDIEYEMHKRYIDIQIDIVGTEVVDIGYGTIKELVPLDVMQDIGFYSVDTYIPCTLGPGKFIMCMDGEPHKPGVLLTENVPLKKCVVKVEVDIG